MRIAELVESLDLPQTRVAERAWEDGRRRLRRRRGAAAGGAAALAVACVVGVAFAEHGNHAATPPIGPSPTRTTEPSTAPLVQDLLVQGHWRAELADMDYQRFGGNLDRAMPLSAAPLDRAALAMGDPNNEAAAYVLGEDGRWRRVDAPGLVPVHDGSGYTSPIVRPTSLSPDATKLALPQPNSLVVVDLTQGSSRRYDVPGPANTYAIWADETHVLVAQELEIHGTMVDLRDGSRSRSAYGPATRFVDDTTLTWNRHTDLLLHSTLHWGDGRTVRTNATNNVQFFPQPPLVKGDVVIGVTGGFYDRPDLTANTTGFVALDGISGRVLAYLPFSQQKGTPALAFGWDGEDPIIGVPLPKEMDGLFVFAWDWRSGELNPIGTVGEWTSWGTGRVRE